MGRQLGIGFTSEMAARFEAEKFTGDNDFGLWRVKMRAMLVQQGLGAVLTSETKVLDEKETLKREEMMAKAHSVIVLCLGDKVLREVVKETNALGILEKLESLYLTKSLANRLYMKQRLYSYRFTEDKSAIEQLGDFNKAIDDLENIDATIGDEDKAILLLNALPKSYEQMRDAIMYGRDKTITLSEVQSALRAKDLQKSGAGSGVEQLPESLNIKKFKGKKGFKKGYESSKPAANDEKEKRSCHWCKKPGHLKRDCFAWKRKQAGEAAQKLRSDCVQETETDQILCVMQEGDGGSWIMDSGCSIHMCPNADLFVELDEATGSVVLGNNQVCSIKGVGTIRFRMNDGSTKILSEVRFIPDVKRNLISLGVLERKGCSFTSFGGKMSVSKGSVVVMEGERRGSLYYLCGSAIRTPTDEVHTSKAETIRLWHLRLGHPAEGSVRELVSKGVIKGAVEGNASPCEDCILGKSKKLPYPKGKHTSQSPLDYIHSDLWGPAPVSSVGGGRYYMSIVDDYSRKVWLFVLKEKSEACKKFKEWCCSVETEIGSAVKCLRTDNGLEFLSKEFDDFCKGKGIKRHRTVPLNPQQNGVAERVNRTIMERVRCMLATSGMDKRFWGEAAATAVKLMNKCPASSLNGDTPDFKWYGGHGDYSKLKVFGCKAYAHLRQSKLDARALKCVFLGYQDGVKGYRLWCIEPGNAKIIISRDVVFLESDMPLRKTPDDSAAVQEKSKKRVAEFEVEQMSATTPINEDGNDQQEESQEAEQSLPNDLADYQLARDRVRRTGVKPPSRLIDEDLLYFALCIAEQVELQEPASYREAMQSKERDRWLRAMIEEIDSLIKNGTWILVDKVDGRKIVSCKWIFKKKIESADNDKIRFKARLVARGFTQEHGIDYNEVFSPVVKHASIRILLAVVAKLDWELEQLDVRTAFLHGDLEETIYMQQPEGFIKPGEEAKVCLLKKSLYGLKQASRQWHLRFDSQMQRMGFSRSKYDSCVYIKRKGKQAVAYLLLYVDDMLVAGACKAEIQQVKDDLKAAFDMKDLGIARRILGMNIVRNRERREIWLSQTDYVSRVLNRFKMQNSRETATPMAQHFKLSVRQKPQNEREKREMDQIPYANIVGSIMYAMISTRPDLAQAISVTSRFMAEHGKEHWLALRWTLRYLKGAGDYGILFNGKHEEGDPLIGFSDSDFAGNVDNRRSQSGYAFTMYGGAVSWKSSLQDVVALSTTEAEYIALTAAVKESIWLRGLAADFGVIQKTMAIGCDNNSAISLAKHQVYHEKSKHIDVKMHFVREKIEEGVVTVFKVDTSENPADMLTKPLPREKFNLCIKLLGLCRVGEMSN